MKTSIAILLILPSFFGFYDSGLSQSDHSQDLQLIISNIKTAEGNMMIAVYDDSQKFMGEDMVVGLSERVTQTGELKVVIKDLPFGIYAISIYHDENSNENLDANFFRIPKEPYGFSNNARGSFGPPKFEAAKFEFNSNVKSHHIKLK